ncbi:MAG: hypothetical protein E6600_17805 [Anaerocolumna aminovalerica]|jgi:hypothetical protein|uniref:hypothetical protein n=1 Tax=Anaerocolumna aminovalerica TaxID=1527 RepID=UPI00248BA2AE|nr:hypothetical protein [Anaerocolumna aminovalerica]MDU6266352.1 hypothetical protein [Anaerocolumna aminovalerica]
MNNKIKKGSKYKKDKSQNKKDNSQNQNITITDWFYMTPSEINGKSIAQLIEEECNTSIELWEEMNILQIELSNKVTIDFEPMNLNFKDPSDMEFINSRNIHTIFSVYIASGVLEEEFKNILKVILDRWEGFLCADSQDFQPAYSLNDL